MNTSFKWVDCRGPDCSSVWSTGLDHTVGWTTQPTGYGMARSAEINSRQSAIIGSFSDTHTHTHTHTQLAAATALCHDQDVSSSLSVRLCASHRRNQSVSIYRLVLVMLAATETLRWRLVRPIDHHHHTELLTETDQCTHLVSSLLSAASRPPCPSRVDLHKIFCTLGVCIGQFQSASHTQDQYRSSFRYSRTARCSQPWTTPFCILPAVNHRWLISERHCKYSTAYIGLTVVGWRTVLLNPYSRSFWTNNTTAAKHQLSATSITLSSRDQQAQTHMLPLADALDKKMLDRRIIRD